jgi:hypothetical protein
VVHRRPVFWANRLSAAARDRVGYLAWSRFQISTIGTWIARLVRTTIENPFKLASPAVSIGPITPAAFELQYPRQIADP